MKFRPVFWFTLLSVSFATLAFIRASVAAPAVATFLYPTGLPLEQTAIQPTNDRQASAGVKTLLGRFGSPCPKRSAPKLIRAF